MIQPMSRVRIKPEHGGHVAEWGTVISSHTEVVPFSDRYETHYLVRFVWIEELDPLASTLRNGGFAERQDEKWFTADQLEAVEKP